MMLESYTEAKKYLIFTAITILQKKTKKKKVGEK